MLLLYEYGTTHNLGFQLVDKEMWMVESVSELHRIEIS